MTTEPTAEQIAAEMSRLSPHEQTEVTAVAKLAVDSQRAGEKLTGEQQKALKAAQEIVNRRRR